METYGLQFGNGQGISLVTVGDAKVWLKRFASILELRPCEPNGHPRLIFSRRGIIDEGGRLSRRGGLSPLARGQALPYSIAGGPLPIRGWRPYDLRIVKIWRHSQVEDIIYELGERGAHKLEIIKMWHVLYPIYIRAERAGGIFLHAGLIGRGSSAVLLAGSSNIGKSTCCRRVPPPWRSLCDETALVLPDEQGGYVAHPFPTWSDYLWRRSERTWHVEEYLPLSAIFFLEQAAADKVTAIDKTEAAAFINDSAKQAYFKVWLNMDPLLQGRQFKKNVFENVCRLARSVPSFILRFSRNGKFWIKIEEALGGV